MSDDPKKPSSPTSLGDLFDKSAGETDDDALSDLAFEAADDSVLEESDAAASPKADATDEPQSADVQPKASVQNSNVVPINGKPPAKGLRERIINPELTDQVRSDAALLRRQASASPLIAGKDADLVQYNGKTKRIEPVSDEAAAMLKRLGEDADLYVTPVGQLLSRPMVYDPQSFSLRPNTRKAVRKAPTAEDAKRSMTPLPKTTDADRMKRMSGLDPESEQARRDREAADRRINNAMNGEGQGEGSQKNGSIPQLTPGAYVLNSIGQGISSAFSLLKRFFQWAGQKLAAIGSKATQMVQDVFDRHTGPENAQFVDVANMTSGTAGPEHYAASVGESGAAGAADQIRNRITQAKQEVMEVGSALAQQYRHNVQGHVGNISEGMGAHEVGAPTINNPEVFKEHLKTRSPTDKAKVTKGIKGIRESGATLAAGVAELANHPSSNLVSSKDKVEIFEGLDHAISEPLKLDVLSQQTLNNAVDIKNGDRSVKEDMDASLAQAQEAVRTRLEQAREQDQVETLARESQQQQNVESESYRPGPG